MNICPHISQSNSKFCQGVRKEADPAGNIWSNSWMNTFESWRPRKAWKRICANKKRYRRRGSNTWITEGLWVDTVGTDGKAARDNLILHTHEVLGPSVCSIMLSLSMWIGREASVSEESKICQTRLRLVRKIAAKDQAEQQATPRANITHRHHSGAMVLKKCNLLLWYHCHFILYKNLSSTQGACSLLATQEASERISSLELEAARLAECLAEFFGGFGFWMSWGCFFFFGCPPTN